MLRSTSRPRRRPAAVLLAALTLTGALGACTASDPAAARPRMPAARLAAGLCAAVAPELAALGQDSLTGLIGGDPAVLATGLRRQADTVARAATTLRAAQRQLDHDPDVPDAAEAGRRLRTLLGAHANLDEALAARYRSMADRLGAGVPVTAVLGEFADDTRVARRSHELAVASDALARIPAFARALRRAPACAALPDGVGLLR